MFFMFPFESWEIRARSLGGLAREGAYLHADLLACLVACWGAWKLAVRLPYNRIVFGAAKRQGDMGSPHRAANQHKAFWPHRARRGEKEKPLSACGGERKRQRETETEKGFCEKDARTC